MIIATAIKNGLFLDVSGNSSLEESYTGIYDYLQLLSETLHMRKQSLLDEFYFAVGIEQHSDALLLFSHLT